jgi:tetratricopeptide (TPR) repeat protein
MHRIANLINNANALNSRGEYGKAADLCRQALRLSSAIPEAWYNLGIALNGLEKRQEALDAFKKTRKLVGNSADALNSIGLQLVEMGIYSEAEQCLRGALTLAPEFVFAHSNFGTLREKQKRYTDAEASFRKAIELQPTLAPLYLNLGAVLNTQHKFADAEQAFRHALVLQPDYAEAKFNLSLLLLSLGRYAEAWPYYESRYDPNRLETIPIPSLAFPQWHGESLENKSLLICPEQGFGDYLQFVRYVPLLKKAGVSKLTLLCDSSLKTLLETIEGVDEISTDLKSVPTHDYWSFLLSIPLHSGTTLNTIPSTLPYLRPTKDRLEYWRTCLPHHEMKVGLVWKGNPKLKADQTRSLTSLAILQPLWTIPNIQFISLQIGAGVDEVKNAAIEQPTIHLGTDIRDFADTAAIVTLLDLVICVDTAVAHVAGALNKPCWLLLPQTETDWRWLQNRSDSPWYPGVMRIFQQSTLGDWGDVITNVVSELKIFVNSLNLK